MRQFAARRDANEADIVEALRAIGVTVHRVSQTSLPDLLTWDNNGRAEWQGRRYFFLPIEVKEANGQLTPAQAETYKQSPFPVVRSVDDALALFGIYAPIEKGLKTMAKAKLKPKRGGA